MGHFDRIKSALRTLRDRTAAQVNGFIGPLVETEMPMTEDRLADQRGFECLRASQERLSRRPEERWWDPAPSSPVGPNRPVLPLRPDRFWGQRGELVRRLWTMDTDADARLNRIESLLADLAIVATDAQNVERPTPPETVAEAKSNLLRFLAERQAVGTRQR